MSIIWCGQEDIDFPNGSPCTYTTTAAHFRAGYARGALNRDAANQVLRSTVFPGGAVTDFWASCQYYFRSGNRASGQTMYGYGKSGTTCLIFLASGTDTYYHLRLVKDDGAGTNVVLATSVTNVLYDNQLYKIDWHVQNFGASATIDIYFDGVLVLTYNGDVTFTGFTSIDQVFLAGNPVDASYYDSMSELIVADEDTRALGLVTHQPNAAGDANAWDGDGYSGINEWQMNDTNLVYTNVSDEEIQVNLLPLPSGSYNVRGVMLSARCVKSVDSTPTKVALGIRNGTGGTINNGADQSLIPSWFTYNRLMQVNPVTGNPFTMAEINDLQFNLKSRA